MSGGVETLIPQRYWAWIACFLLTVCFALLVPITTLFWWPTAAFGAPDLTGTVLGKATVYRRL